MHTLRYRPRMQIDEPVNMNAIWVELYCLNSERITPPQIIWVMTISEMLHGTTLSYGKRPTVRFMMRMLNAMLKSANMIRTIVRAVAPSVNFVELISPSCLQ